MTELDKDIAKVKERYEKSKNPHTRRALYNLWDALVVAKQRTRL